MRLRDLPAMRRDRLGGIRIAEEWTKGQAMIAGVTDSGALPALERLVQFTGARHRVLVDNIANLSTPYYRARDLDPAQFQQTLGRAIDERRSRGSAVDGPLDVQDTRELTFHEDRIEARPGLHSSNLTFHDRNDRNLERVMQSLAENTLAHNAAIEMLRNQFDLLETAIRERVA